jgi:acetolactate synthase I/III small subunit
MNESTCTVIKLKVRNNPGVMYHITGLFSRRAFNLEGILCGELADGTTSQIYLLVKVEQSLDQIVKQLNKLHDVLEVSLMKNYDHGLFNKIHDLINAKSIISERWSLQ